MGLYLREWVGDFWFVDICLFLFIYWVVKFFVFVVRVWLNVWVVVDLCIRIIFILGNKWGGSFLKGFLVRWDFSFMFFFLFYFYDLSGNIVKYVSLKMVFFLGMVMLNLRCGRIKIKRFVVINLRIG